MGIWIRSQDRKSIYLCKDISFYSGNVIANYKSWMAKKYGKLNSDWKQTISRGFSECMRVLETNGVLIFKWSDKDIKQKELFEVIGTLPLIGDRERGNNSYWYVFMKESR